MTDVPVAEPLAAPRSRITSRAPSPESPAASELRRSTGRIRRSTARLVIGRADDRAEREADAAARAVMTRITARTDGPIGPEQGEVGGRPLARRGRTERDPLGGHTVPGHIETRIERHRGGGAPLPEPTRQAMESAFGTGLGDVRVHADTESAALTASVDSVAFTTGSDIFFGAGEYRPASTAGQELLAHELTHVIQQSGPVARTIRRRGNPERVRNEKVRLWTERIQPAVAGLSVPDARAICEAAVDSGLSVVDAQALAGLLPAGWPVATVLTLIRRFKGAPGNLTITEWVDVAGRAPFINQLNDVASFARQMPGWSGPQTVELARMLALDAGGRGVQFWRQLATHDPALTNRPEAVAQLARLANGWLDANILTLVGLFAAGNGGRPVTVWARIAASDPGLANQPPTVAAFARVANGWKAPHIATFAGLYAANPGGRGLAGWTLVAGADPGIANKPYQAAWFARIANGWLDADVAALIPLFVANSGQRPPRTWARIAGSHAALTGHHADVATLARLAPAWTDDNVVNLARLFGVKSGGRALQFWCQLATHDPIVANDPDGVAQLARLANGWLDANILALVGLYALGNGGRPATVWAQIAASHAGLANQPPTVAAFAGLASRWKKAPLASLAGLYAAVPAGGRRSLAGWTQIADADAGVANKPSHVAAFAKIANGWLDADVATLVPLFVANSGQRQPRLWARIAACHAGLTGQHADVATLARVAAAWNDDDNVVNLATLFATNAGGRPATDWQTIAGVDPNLANQEDVVAGLARAAWTAADAGAFVATVVAGGTTMVTLGQLFAVVGAATDALAMLPAGWTAGPLGTFLSTVLVTPVTPVNCAAMLAEATIPAATNTMSATWSDVALGAFVGSALRAGAAPLALAGLMNTALFPATAAGLIAGAWTRRSVGAFCGAALASNVTAADLQATIVTAGMPVELRRLSAAGNLTTRQAGTYIGHVRAGGVPEAYILDLLRPGAFPTSATAMLTAGWTPVQFGDFTIGAHGTGITATQLATLLADPQIAAASFPWLGAGFTANEVGEIAAKARLAGSTPDKIRLFMNQAGAAAACFALHVWTALGLGETFGHVLSRAGPPTYAEMVQVFQICQPMVVRGAPLACTALAVRNVADGVNCGPPTWANVIARAPAFGVAWTGPVGRGAAEIAAATFNGAQPGRGVYRVRLRVTEDMREHVERRHTHNYAEMDYNLMMREGPNGNISFYAPNTNITNLLTPLVNNLQAMADRVVWSRNEQADIGNERLALTRDGNAPVVGGPVVPTKGVYVSQFYPRFGGIQIQGKDVVAIGRLLGRIP